MASTAGRAPSWKRWPPPRSRLDRSDVADPPVPADLLVVHAQPATVVERLFGLVGDHAVHEDHHGTGVAVCVQHSDADDVDLADDLSIARLRDDVLGGVVLVLATELGRQKQVGVRTAAL